MLNIILRSTSMMKLSANEKCLLFLVSVPVTAGQNLILAAAVQSVGRALFNIQVTLVGCGLPRQQELSEDWDRAGS